MGLSSFIFEAGKDVDRLFGLSCVFFFASSSGTQQAHFSCGEDNGLDVGWALFFSPLRFFFFCFFASGSIGLSFFCVLLLGVSSQLFWCIKINHYVFVFFISSRSHPSYRLSLRYGWYKIPCGDHVWLFVALGDSVETFTCRDHTFVTLVFSLCSVFKNVFV